jgi:hypothetical protein
MIVPEVGAPHGFRPRVIRKEWCSLLSRAAILTLVAALTLALPGLLHAPAGCTAVYAQPSPRTSYRSGATTFYQGNDRNGAMWTGRSYQQGYTTYFDANGPHGEQRHCRSWQQGRQTFTECQ